MSGKQLDFLTRLRAALNRPLPKPTPPPPPPVPDESELLEKARQLLLSIGCTDLAARLQFRWNPKMRSTAGLAYPSKALVVLNPRLKEFGDEEIDRTLRHELAHLLAHHRAGRRKIAPHGPEWRRACRDLGLVNEQRCHELPLPRRTMTRQHVYRCPACAYTVKRVRPIRRASACLACCRAYSAGRYDERFRLVKVSAADVSAIE